jgi:HAMP domain-containing protein
MAESTEQLPSLSFDYLKGARLSRGVLATLSDDDVRSLAERYRRFLALKAKYPRQAIAPTEIIDEMWHLHMLHPRAYHRDCMQAFGFILDHNPGFGAEEDEVEALASTFARTAERYEREFGESYSLPGQPLQNVIICADEAEDEEDEEGAGEEEPEEVETPAPAGEARLLVGA